MNILKWRFLPNSLKRKLLQAFRYRIQPFVYVALGDSTAEGMGASAPERSYASIVHLSLKDRYRSTKFINYARSGAVLTDVLTRQLPKALEARPNLVTVSVGANDIIKRTKAEKFEKDLRKLLRTLQRETDATIVISTVPDLSLTPTVPKILKTYSRYMANRLNEIIVRIADETNTVLVDIFNDSKAVLQTFPEAIASDGWHPSDFGYALWANSILVTLRNVIAPPERERVEPGKKNGE